MYKKMPPLSAMRMVPGVRGVHEEPTLLLKYRPRLLPLNIFAMVSHTLSSSSAEATELLFTWLSSSELRSSLIRFAFFFVDASFSLRRLCVDASFVLSLLDSLSDGLVAEEFSNLRKLVCFWSILENVWSN